MTVEVSRDALLGALRSVVDMVEKRTTIPVLSNLLFVAEGGRVSVTATDLDRHAIARCEAAGELCTTMPADKLLAAVSSLKPGVKLTIEPIAGRAAVTIKGGGGKRTIPTLPAKDFPERELPQDATRFSVSAAQFVRMLDAVGIAQSAEETRYYLIGVYLHAADKLLRAAATDGQRLMRAEIPLPEGAEAMPAVIIPTKAVTALRKLLGKAEGDAVLSVTSDLIAVQFGEATILSRTVEGSYPDYSRVIPSDGRHRLSTSRDALLAAANAVASTVEGEGKNRYRVVRLQLSDTGSHEAWTRDDTGADATEPFEGELTGGHVLLGLNHKFLSSALGVFAEGATLAVDFDSPSAAVRVTSDKDPDLVGVIMPMRA